MQHPYSDGRHGEPRPPSDPPPPLPDPRTEFLGLFNPPLAISAAAESLAAGFVATGSVTEPLPYLLAFASALLFAAGSAFSHYFDRPADTRRQPNRPLPTRRVEPARLWNVACALLVLGPLASGLAGQTSALAAIGVALCVVLYAAVTKSVWGAGYMTLAAARGANLLFGLTAGGEGWERFAIVALVPVPYMLGWALLRGSIQPGAPPSTGFVGLVHLLAGLSAFTFIGATRFANQAFAILVVLALLALLAPRFVRAVLDPRRYHVLEAVQYGFLGLSLMETGLAAGYAGLLVAIVTGLLCVALYYALRKWPQSLVLAPR